MVSAIGAVFALIALWAVILRRSAIPWVLVLAAPFSTTSAVSIADNSIPPFYLVAMIVAPVTIVRFIFDRTALVGRSRVLLALGLLAAWAVLVTVASPHIFAGIDVLDPRGGIDQQVFAPTPLEFSTGNIAQLAYLGLALVAVLAFVQAGAPSKHLLGAGLALGTVLSASRLAMGSAWPTELFDNYANVGYWESDYQGVTRHRGIYSEPSYLGVLSLATIVYSTLMALQSRGRMRILYGMLSVAAGLNLVLSYSGTGTLGALVIAGLYICLTVARTILRGQRIPAGVAITALAGASAFVIVTPFALKAALGLIDQKMSSASFSHRTASDVISLRITTQTWGLGAGLGSNRPSSFATMLASNVGIIGLILFALALARVCHILFRSGSALLPTGWALVSILVAKVIADPAMSTPLMWCCLGIGAACEIRFHRLPETEPSATISGLDRAQLMSDTTTSGLRSHTLPSHRAAAQHFGQESS